MTASQRLRVGSRESPLAQAQARHVMALLQGAHPELILTLETFKTTGDLNLAPKLSEIGDKGLFTKELELALEENRIDVAIHSMKDMPGELPSGLELTAVGEREDPRDVLIAREEDGGLDALPQGGVVGTSSTRRIAMLKRLRPDLICENIRGNLQTRLRKLRDEPKTYDAILLAAAGVHRLGWEKEVSAYLDPIQAFVPAPGQGILAAEYRGDDETAKGLLAKVVSPAVHSAMRAERTVLQTLQAGCHTPLGVYAQPEKNAAEQFVLHAVLLTPDGSDSWVETCPFEASQAETCARDVAGKLLAFV